MSCLTSFSLRIRPFTVLAMLIVMGVLLPTTAMSQGIRGALRVGVCQRDITPISPSLADEYEAAFGGPAVVNHTDPIFLAGFGDNRMATGYNDRLWARGVVLDGPGGRVAIVALDLIGYFANEVETIRSAVSADSAIDYLIVHNTTGHEGPDTLGLWGPDPFTTGIDFGYLDFVNASVADCVDEAASNLERARVRYATTASTGLSLGLDAEDDGFGVADGKVLVDDDLISPDTQGRIVDPQLSIMQLIRLGPPTVLATVLNFGSNPESLGGSNTLITSDFPHYARERIEAEFGGMAIWTSGAMGVLQSPLDIDVSDPLTGSPAPRRTFRFAEVHGQELAERAIAAIATSKPGSPVPKVAFASTNPVAIRLDNPFFRLYTALGVINSRRMLFTSDVPDGSVGFPFPPPFETLPQALGEDIHTEVGALRIGNASFAIVPSKVDPQISQVYRERMVGAEHTFILGNANGSIGEHLLAAKWDDSCHSCAPYILAGVPQFCPIFPNIDCNTAFQDNVGADVDPSISTSLLALIDTLHP